MDNEELDVNKWYLFKDRKPPVNNPLVLATPFSLLEKIYVYRYTPSDFNPHRFIEIILPFTQLPLGYMDINSLHWKLVGNPHG